MKKLTDTEYLEWVLKHKAIVYIAERTKTRRGGLDKINLEVVWTVDWESKNGSDVMQGVDGGYKTFREALDAAIADEKQISKTV